MQSLFALANSLNGLIIDPSSTSSNPTKPDQQEQKSCESHQHTQQKNEPVEQRPVGLSSSNSRGNIQKGSHVQPNPTQASTGTLPHSQQVAPLSARSHQGFRRPSHPTLVITQSCVELGVGLAGILNSFLEFTPPHLQEQFQKEIAANEDSPASTNPFRLFCSQAPITLEAFGERLGVYFACSPVCFHVAAVYLGRVWAANPEIFDPLSVFKLMLIALTVAVKFVEDKCSTQVHYAKCGGIEVSELNILEMLFMTKYLHFDGFVREAELQIAVVTLDKYCGGTSNASQAVQSPLVRSAAQENPSKPTKTLDTPAPSAFVSGLRKISHSSF